MDRDIEYLRSSPGNQRKSAQYLGNNLKVRLCPELLLKLMGVGGTYYEHMGRTNFAHDDFNDWL
jgi:hypothetical protein